MSRSPFVGRLGRRFLWLLPFVTTALLAEGCGLLPHRSVNTGPLVERAWTQPIRYHDVRVQFELDPAEEERIVFPGAELDVIGVVGPNQRGMEYRFQSYYASGRKIPTRAGDAVRLFLPPKPGSPWRRRYFGDADADGREDVALTLIWAGRPREYVIECANMQSVVWSIPGGATVEFNKSGEVVYRHLKTRQVLRAPVTLYFDQSGAWTTLPEELR